MNPVLRPLADALMQAAQAAGFAVEGDQVHLEATKTLEHGHFASNLALALAKSAQKPPRQVAEAIVPHLDSPLIRKTEVAGPGFINLWIEQKFYTKNLRQLIQDPDSFLRIQEKRTMAIDYSHPNIAKPMGVHHLLSTIIGDAIKKSYRQRGWTVIADNFIGDMGTQFGKLMHAIKKWGSQEAIERDPIRELQKLYVQFHAESEKDEGLDEEGRAEYLRFEQGEPEARLMWRKIVEWSLQEIQPIYDALGVEFDCMNGESFYEEKMGPILEEGRRSGVIVDGESGSWIIPAPEPEGVPVLVRKSDGATLYATRDLARTKYWEEAWHPDLMVMVTDVAQEFHFRQVFFAAQKLGLTPARNVNVNFGRMQFKDGKMSTRKGNIILLNQVLDEAKDRALALVKEKGQDLSGAEELDLARKMGINSIKYNILCQNRSTNIIFDWDKMLSFEGNSAPYLMYTLARAKSVLRKAGFGLSQVSELALDQLSEAETQVALHLLGYPEALERATDEFKPNLLANFLYQLAQDYNHFYNGHSILQAESEALKASRLLLTAATIQAMELAFEALGLESLEKM